MLANFTMLSLIAPNIPHSELKIRYYME